MKKVLVTIGLLFLMTSISQAQDEDGFLTIDRIYKNYEFFGDYFGSVQWVENESAYTMLERSSEVPGGLNIVQYDIKTGDKEPIVAADELIPEDKEKPIRIEKYEWSPDQTKLLLFTNSKRVWRYNTKGDYWIFDLQTRSLSQLGKDLPESSLMFTKFAPEGKRVAYVSEHNIFIEDIESGKITQLTFDGNDDIINGTFDWVYEEEFSCRDGFRWSPDGKKIAYWKLDATGVRDFYMINNTDSLYSYIIPVEYPKAGETLSSARVGVISSSGGETTWIKTEGDPRNNYIPRMEWAANSSELILQYMNRYQNTNQVLMADVNTGNIKTIMTEKDEAWLDPVDDWTWMPDGEQFTWISERTGWRHIYLVSRNGEEVQPVTSGHYDVINIVKIDEKRGFVYFIASPDNATQRYLFRKKMNGKGKMEKLSPTNMNGTHSYDISDDSKYAIHTFSSFETPPITDIVTIPKHEQIKLLVSNEGLKTKYELLKKGDVEFFKVTTEDNVTMDGVMIKPYNFNPDKKYPVLFYAYSEPAGQTVLDRWGGTTYMWHLMLAQKGYIIVSVDNRGTPAPKGRAWRKAIYRKMGILNSGDQAAAAREIIQWPFIDEERVGIWGWSGGGSATLNAMFRYPEIYKVGMSVAPVPDIHLYDAIYQERYCGLPQENEEEYFNSSALNFAQNLEGKLLIVHGTGDDNVHYQGTEKLINKLVEHNKQFTMFAYPNRSHGIYEGPNTSRHLRYLLTNFLMDNLEPGGK